MQKAFLKELLKKKEEYPNAIFNENKTKDTISFDSNNDKPHNTPQPVIYHRDLDVWWHDAAKILPKY